MMHHNKMNIKSRDVQWDSLVFSLLWVDWKYVKLGTARLNTRNISQNIAPGTMISETN